MIENEHLENNNSKIRRFVPGKNRKILHANLSLVILKRTQAGISLILQSICLGAYKIYNVAKIDNNLMPIIIITSSNVRHILKKLNLVVSFVYRLK